MKNFTKASMLSLLLTLSVSFAMAAGNGTPYSVSTQKSTLKWTGKKVTGQHNGSVALSAGTLMVENNVLTGGKFDIDLKTITCEDLKDAEYNAKLVGHLKSDDFFSVEKSPIAAVEIVSATKKAGDSYDITAKLTIKGITKDITFPATVKVTGKNVVAVAKITVDRSQFDIRYGSSSFFEGLGDKAIDNEFMIDVTLAATK